MSAINESSEQHNLAHYPCGDTTLRLEKPVAELLDWAENNDLADELQLVISALRLYLPVEAEESKVTGLSALAFFYKYVAGSSARQIIPLLEQWADNAVCIDILRLHHAFKKSGRLELVATGKKPNTDSMLPGRLSDQYLLALVISDPGGCDIPELQSWRQQLRLWTVVQAFTYLRRFNTSLDGYIRTVARFISIEPASPGTPDRPKSINWEFVDSLYAPMCRKLGQAQRPEFHHFCAALAESAAELMQTESDASSKKFFNAVFHLACFERHPIYYGGTQLYDFPFTLSNPINIEYTFDEQKTFHLPPLASIDPWLAEEDEGLIAVDVSEAKSLPEQQRATRSILIQRAELSHYLPWCWETVLPNEKPMFDIWLEQRTNSSNAIEQAGAALVWLALHTARTLLQISRFRFSSTPVDEWVLAPDCRCLLRKAPSRHCSWLPDPAQKEVVEAFAEVVVLEIPEIHRAALIDLIGKFPCEGTCISDHWCRLPGARLEDWFEQQMQTDLPRIKQRMLATVIPQQIFDATGQANTARLFSIHPNSATPGAIAYTSISAETLKQNTGQSFSDSNNRSDKIVLFGSRLNPLEKHLRLAVTDLMNEVESARSMSLVRFHNCFVAYIILSLQASTGSRPIRDPFEKQDHFNWWDRFVYVDDKSSSESHQGRLCALPSALEKQIKIHYLEHLKHLSEALDKISSPLATEIKSILDPNGSPSLPFFFFLDERLEWFSVSSDSIDQLAIWNSCLPSNLFRHRFIRQLTDLGVDAEVIDGLAGHAERGVASYGDASIRCWKRDIEIARPMIEKAFDNLGFRTLSGWVSAPDIQPPVESGRSQNTRRYGAAARAHERLTSKRDARQGAKSAIRTKLKSLENHDPDSPGSLSSDVVNDLVDVMVLTDSGTPHPNAAIRYGFFLRWLAVQQVKQRPFLKAKKRFILHAKEPSHFLPSIPTLLPLFHDLQREIKRLTAEWAKGFSPSLLHKSDCLVVGAVLAAMESRLCYQQLLKDVLRNRHSQLIYFEERNYLAYAENLLRSDLSSHVQRHQISRAAASFLAFGFSLENRVDIKTQRIPELMLDLAALVSNGTRQHIETAADLIAALCPIIDAANRVELPGMLSGTLSGRMPATCLDLVDWVRARSGRCIDIKEQPDNGLVDDFNIEQLINAQVSKFQTAPLALRKREELEQNARAFSAAVREALNHYTPSNPDSCAKKIQRLCGEWQTCISPTMLLLGEWIVYRIKNGRRDSGGSLERSSVTQYFSQLSGPFCGLAYELDLLACEPDEITELYCDIIDLTDRSPVTQKYLIDRLHDFHNWAETRGVARPFWSELDLPELGRSVSPGVILEQEYLSALQLILRSLKIESKDFRYSLAFVLLCCYRFGLRASEAIGLQLRDWHSLSGQIVIYVRPNASRGLKSVNSRRPVPLLFKLDPIEQEIIDHILAHALSDANLRETTHLIGNGIDGKPSPLASLIAPTLIKILRYATGNEATVLHHCRHTFHCICAAVLFEMKSTLVDAVVPTTVDRAQFRKTILGSNAGASRRSSMALARLMGHARPQTGVLHYNHMLADWADQWCDVPRIGRFSLHTKALTPGRLPIKGDVSTAWLEAYSPSFCTPSIEVTMRVMKLLSLGKSWEQARDWLRLPDAFVRPLWHCIETVGNRMTYNKTQYRPAAKDLHSTVDYLCQIKNPSWKGLLRHVKKNDSPPSMESPVGLNELPFLIGENRQILLEDKSHFQLMRYFVDFFCIPDEAVLVFQRDGATDLAGVALDYGFAPASARHEKAPNPSGGSGFVPRFAFDPLNKSTGYKVNRSSVYCALLIPRNSKHVLRTSFDVVAALIAYAAVVEFNSLGAAVPTET